MAQRFLPELMSPAIQEAEQHYYGRTYALPETAPPQDALTPEDIEFIQNRDSFYMATITANGWPYLQHRGGPVGFLRVLSPHRLAFADYGGNRQMLTTGNVAGNDRVTLFLMDYPRRERLKILGHAQVLDVREHPEMVAQLAPSTGHPSKPERIFVIDIVSYDWNCPRFITPRYTAEEVKVMTEPLHQRIAELEAKLRSLSLKPE